MLKAVHLRAISSTSSHPYLYSVQPLPQVDQATSRPSPEAISRKPIRILLTLLKSTLTGVLPSVASKALTGMLTPLDATFTKKRGGRGILSRHATPCYGGCLPKPICNVHASARCCSYLLLAAEIANTPLGNQTVADSRCLQGAYCGLEDAARLWSSAVRSNSALARSRAFISLYNFPN